MMRYISQLRASGHAVIGGNDDINKILMRTFAARGDLAKVLSMIDEAQQLEPDVRRLPFVRHSMMNSFNSFCVGR
jgi:hypothetical protein